jgi:hypothetical protein
MHASAATDEPPAPIVANLERDTKAVLYILPIATCN